jgi:hypothetical protein
MYYYNYDSNKFRTPIHSEYESYKVPYVLEISKDENNKENILIVYEGHNELMLLKKNKEIRKGVYFVSVDNYYFDRALFRKNAFFFQRALNKLMKLMYKPPFFDVYSQKNLERVVKKYDYRSDNLLKLADFYMINSYRGLKWFSDLKPMYLLPDCYINSRFIQESNNIDLIKKEDVVIFNPKKGYQFTKKIIKFASDIRFIPIENMTREQVINTIKIAKVYIDFGNFPGPERIPKEAAMLGCCVITGKRGCAEFFEDVPIPDNYKFEDKEENIPKIVNRIKDCFDNFEERHKDFNNSREIIRGGKNRFIEDLRKIFVKA